VSELREVEYTQLPVGLVVHFRTGDEPDAGTGV
jgi:hypothetical protein